MARRSLAPSSIWHKLHFRLPVFPEILAARHVAEWNYARVVLGWAKLVAVSLVMSMVITAAAGAGVWLISK
jgi:hypothetical protein